MWRKDRWQYDTGGPEHKKTVEQQFADLGRGLDVRRASQAKRAPSTLSTVSGQSAAPLALDSSTGPSIASSTPPTTPEDSSSVAAEALKHDQDAFKRRTGRERKHVTTYNLNQISGSAVHAPKKRANKAESRTISGETLIGDTPEANNEVLKDGIKALDLDWKVDALPGDPVRRTVRDSPKKSSRQPSILQAAGNAVSSAVSALGKRSHDIMESGQDKLHAIRESILPSGSDAPPKKRVRVEDIYLLPERKTKRWETQGLYVGQERNFNPKLSGAKNRIFKKPGVSEDESKQEKNPKLASYEQHTKDDHPRNQNAVMPFPMFKGANMVFGGDDIVGQRDFKLPFDVYSPLFPILPEANKKWKSLKKNILVGDAVEIWKKQKPPIRSLCLCTKEEGCGERCLNRLMEMECDANTCNIGAEHCTNRAFAELRNRRDRTYLEKPRDAPDRPGYVRGRFATTHGNFQADGVQVMDTGSRGYGVRAVTTFEQDQIIVEYLGEVITQEECERRMHTDYKDNKCFYLMTFDKGLIIDATKDGSIAKFVNHSCNPNCVMEKRAVAGQPRMALFAKRAILTGEELTYDYNFSPFSSDNVQKCLCGAVNCRGFLGPTPKDNGKPKVPKVPTVAKRKPSKAAKPAPKRKAAVLEEDDDSPDEEEVSRLKRAKSIVAKVKAAAAKTKETFDKAVDKASAKPSEALEHDRLRAERAARRSTSTLTLTSATPSPRKKWDNVKPPVATPNQSDSEDTPADPLPPPSRSPSKATRAWDALNNAVKPRIPSENNPLKRRQTLPHPSKLRQTTLTFSKVTTITPFKENEPLLSGGGRDEGALNGDGTNGDVAGASGDVRPSVERASSSSSTMRRAESLVKGRVSDLKGSLSKKGKGVKENGLGAEASRSTIRLVGEDDDVQE